MSSPLVSVVIPAYNGGTYIERTLDSVFRQSHPHVEVIVVDDGSTDDTTARLQPYRTRIHYIQQPNAGVGAARNRGIRASTGDYIAFLDHDDLWHPEKLRVQLGVAARNPGSGLIACDGVKLYGEEIVPESLLMGVVADRMRTLQCEEITGYFYREFILGVPIASASQMLVSRGVATTIGPMITAVDESEDWDYTLRISRQFPVTLHGHSLVSWRIHGGSKSGNLGRRRIEHALWNISVQKRHRKLCAREDLPFVKERLLAEIGETAYTAYREGRTGSRAFAYRTLWRLLQRAPWEPRVWLTVAAMWFPKGLVSHVARRAPRAMGASPGRSKASERMDEKRVSPARSTLDEEDK